MMNAGGQVSSTRHRRHVQAPPPSALALLGASAATREIDAAASPPSPRSDRPRRQSTEPDFYCVQRRSFVNATTTDFSYPSADSLSCSSDRTASQSVTVTCSPPAP